MRRIGCSLVALCSPLAAAQAEPARASVLGLIKADPDAWTGATVVLLSRPFPADARVGAADRIEVVTAGSEFRAKVLLGRTYSVWASKPRLDGSLAFTAVHEQVTAGMGLALVPEPDPRRAQRVRVTGHAAWSEVAGSLRLRASAAITHTEIVAVELDAHGECALPELPGKRFTLSILRADGCPLTWQSMYRGDLTGRDEVVLTLDPPRPLRAFVYDHATGVGVGGATILRSDGGRTYPLARTAADGTVEVAVPWPTFIRRGLPSTANGLLVQADGYALEVLIVREAYAEPPLPPAGFVPDLRAPLRRAPARAGRWRAGNDAVAGLSVVAFCEVASRALYPEKLPYVHLVRTGVDGRFVLPDTSSGEPPMVAVVLTAEHLMSLPARWRDGGVHPLVFAACATDQLGDLDLLALEAVELRLQRPDGLPAAFAPVDLLPVRPIGERFERFPAHADRRGRLRLQLGGERFVLYARLDGASAIGELEIPSLLGPRGVHEIDIALRPRLVLSGVVCAADGKPVPNAALRLDLDAESSRATELRRGPTAWLRELDHPTSARQVFERLTLSTSVMVKADADGAFRCEVEDLPLDYVFRRAADRSVAPRALRYIRPRDEPRTNLRIELSTGN